MIPIEIYRKEIFDFLKTVTIKFTPFSFYYKTIINNCSLEENINDEKNKYYLNLCGEYHSLDEPIYITSIDDNSKIILTKENLLNHPRTAAVYKVPNKEFDILCDRYPLQKGLIKSIIYPVSDIDTVVKADNLSLLACDEYLLHINERKSLIDEITIFLNYMRDRWYTQEFVYEDLYLSAFWSMIWYHLPQLLLAKRIDNIKTSSVHPFHIWEYLNSKGLKNYSDILTNKQALWLYRNIDYIYKNEGKQSNLFKLSDNLLADQHVSLVGKTIYQQPYDKANICYTVPEYISENIVSYKRLKDDFNRDSYESITSMNNRLFISGLEIKNDVAYVEKISERYAEVPQNILPTKLVEIQKNIIDTRYANLLAEFMMDTYVYRYTIDNIRYQIKLNDPLSSISIELHPGEALALFNYCVHKSLNQDPIYIPNKYISRIAYENKKHYKTDIDKYIKYDNTDFQLDAIVDVEKTLNQIPFIPGPIDNINQFIDLTVKQFRVMQYHVRKVRTSGELLYMKGMCNIYDTITVHRELNFNLVNETNYEVWINSNEILKSIIEAYESSPGNKDLYDKLALELFLKMVPIDDPLYREFMGITEDMDALYQGLKNLFIQLCSYNITFLDTDRIRTQYLFLLPIAYTPDHDEFNSHLDLYSYYAYDIFGKHIDKLTFPFYTEIISDGHQHKNDIDTQTGFKVIKNKDKFITEGKYFYGSIIDFYKSNKSTSTIPFNGLSFEIRDEV